MGQPVMREPEGSESGVTRRAHLRDQMRMGGFSWLSRRGTAGDHTHALFADQSHSLPDNLVALLRRL
jgi:hypothetical protein